MRSNSSIYQSCKLYCEATLETDLAKRIMLSIIPAVQSKTEQFHTGGFDYKALKSAVNGAKDLIKFGARACVDELKHAGNPNDSEKRDQIKHNEETLNDRDQAVEALATQDYKTCLIKSYHLFNNADLWESSYGSAPWARIAKTLFELTKQQEQLTNIRKQMNDPNRDQNTDYLSAEVDVMKHMVITMNVFDGLAHNTANVMDNLAEEEMNEMGITQFRAKQKVLEDDTIPPQDVNNVLKRVDQEIRTRRFDYMKQIQRLMDAKELDDPFIAYKQVQHIIEQNDNKHLFGDYIKRIHNDPRNQTNDTQKDIENKLTSIRYKKQLKEGLTELNKAAVNLTKSKDDLLQIKTVDQLTTHKVDAIAQYAKMQIMSLESSLSNMRDVLLSQFSDIEEGYNVVWKSPSAQALFMLLRDRLENVMRPLRVSYTALQADVFVKRDLGKVSDIVNDTYKLKQVIAQVNTLVDQL